MKRIVYIIGFLLALNVGISAQEKGAEKSSAPAQKKEKSEEDKKVSTEKEGFVDANGDGINDNAPKRKRQHGKWNNDKFVDNDGDGINDNRCQGLGFGNKGKMKMYGKRGK